jgi:phospholipid-binding lipoprotein MlaA
VSRPGYSVAAFLLLVVSTALPAGAGVSQQPQAPVVATEIEVDPIFGDSDPLFDDDFEDEEPDGYPDPLEESNRAVLKFNQGLDRVLLGPVVNFFAFVTPNQVKFALRRFFTNLNSPVVTVNDLLQLEWKEAAVTIGGFAINTTVGIGGLFEPAAKMGLPRHRSDFGQTLAIAEVPSGPYLMIPVLGPSTARDTAGSAVDLLMRPTTWFLPFATVFYYSGEGVVTLEEHHAGIRELERSSVDFYSVLRSAYYQNRVDEVWGRRKHRRPEF